MKAKVFSILALLLMAAGGAVAQNANSVNAREFTRTASGSWVLDSMPAFNGVLEITLKEAYRLDSIPLSWTVMVAGEDKSAQVTAYTAEEGPDTLGWLNILEGDTVMLVPPTAVKPTVKNVTLVEAAAVEGHALADAVVGEIVGTDGQAYAVADKDNLPEGVTAAGMVAYKSGSNGLVIALTDEASTMDWITATGASGAAAHTPAVEGKTWKVPSQAEWKQMFSANGGNEGSCTGLNTAITNAGGTALKITYWSSTKEGIYQAYYGYFAGGGAGFYNVEIEDSYSVRACLTF